MIELKLESNKLLVETVTQVTNLDCDKMEIAVCNDTVFTFYQYKNEDGIPKYSLEQLSLKTKHINFIFKGLSENDQIGENDDEVFLINSKLKIFSITHYNLVENDIVINDEFRNIFNK